MLVTDKGKTWSSIFQISWTEQKFQQAHKQINILN